MGTCQSSSKVPLAPPSSPPAQGTALHEGEACSLEKEAPGHMFISVLSEPRARWWLQWPPCLHPPPSGWWLMQEAPGLLPSLEPNSRGKCEQKPCHRMPPALPSGGGRQKAMHLHLSGQRGSAVRRAGRAVLELCRRGTESDPQAPDPPTPGVLTIALDTEGRKGDRVTMQASAHNNLVGGGQEG